MTISILIPTRLRSHKLQKLIDNIFATCINPKEVEVLFLLEKTDEASVQFSHICTAPNVRWFICDSKADKIIYSDLANILYKESLGDIILLGADDIYFHFFGWDILVTKYFEASSDKIILLVPKDGIQNGQLAPHFFLHRNWIDTLGYVQPPLFNSWYNDNWVTDIAKSLDRYIYIPEFYLEHFHPSVGKAQLDQTSTEKDSGIGEDHIVWKKSQNLKQLDIEKLRKFIENHKNN